MKLRAEPWWNDPSHPGMTALYCVSPANRTISSTLIEVEQYPMIGPIPN
jgi:hypothetical protein